MTESKTYPKIERSKREGMLFFPDNIVAVQKDIDGKLETFYQYDLIKIPNTGQQIDDYNLFKKQNYAELRKIAYGDWQEQFEVMQEQGFEGWQDHCQTVKIEYPKVEAIEKEEEI